MGKNTNKPVHKSQLASSGEPTDPSEGKMPMSKEMEDAQLERLLNPVERPSWEQFKEQQRLKGEMEGKEAREEEEAQRVRCNLHRTRMYILSPFFLFCVRAALPRGARRGPQRAARQGERRRRRGWQQQEAEEAQGQEET